MVVWIGTCCFGIVLGWVTGYLVHHGLPIWREIKTVLGVLFGAALQAIFGGFPGMLVYGVGVFIGVVLYGVTLLIVPLRRAHNITEG